MRVLVTGGAGFIGSHIVDMLVAQGAQVVVLDDFSVGTHEHSEVVYVRASITDPAAVAEAMQNITHVVHAAAISTVPACQEDQKKAQAVNVAGTALLVQEAKKQNVERFVFTSSAAVYGNTAPVSTTEDAPVHPESVYAHTKVEGEQLMQSSKVPSVSLRLFNVYGSRQVGGVIPAFVHAKKNKKDIVIEGAGTQSRDFVHVHDVARAIDTALQHAAAVGEVFNIGTGIQTSVLELAQLIGGERVQTTHFSPRKGDVQQSCANIQKAKIRLGWSPKTTLPEGLSAFVSEEAQGDS